MLAQRQVLTAYMAFTILWVVDKCAVNVQANLVLVLVLGKMIPCLLPQVVIRTS